MGRPATLKVDIIADAKGVHTGTSQAESRLGKFGSTVGKAGKLAAIGLAGAGVAAIGFAAGAIKAAEAGRAADNRVAAVNRSMGLFGKNTANVTNRLLNYSDAMARSTGVDDDVIKGTQAKLLTFKELAKTADRVGGAFDRATNAAVDMAAAGFGTAEGNAVQLGKALNDPIKGITALNKSGITFTATEKARIQTLVDSNRMGEAQAMILKAIETQVGGTAQATATGSARMSVAFGQLQEKVGNALLPVFDKLTAFTLDTLLPAASRLAGFLAKNLAPAFRTVGTFVARNVVPVLKGLAGFVTGSLVPAISRVAMPVIHALQGAFRNVGQAIDDNRPQLTALLNGLKTVAGFILRVVSPILGKLIGTGFKVLGHEISLVIRVISGLVKGVQAVVDAFKTVFGWIGKVADKLAMLKPPGWLSHVPGMGWLGSGVPLIGPAVGLVGGGPSWGPGPGGLATAAMGLPTVPGSVTWSGTGLAPTIVDRRDLSTTVHIDGALDTVGVARQLESILDAHAIRVGRVSAYGPAR